MLVKPSIIKMTSYSSRPRGGRLYSPASPPMLRPLGRAGKVCSPTTSLTFLGIELDLLAQELRLPPDKLTQLKREVHQWQHRRSCTKRELQSFLGLLNHAASVIGPGRTFMCTLVDLLKGVKCQHHHIHLRAQARDNLLWWAVFSEAWNGVSSIPNSGAPPITFSSDASGAWGCGAAWRTQWLQLRWPDVNIAIKEMVPVILAAAVWGPVWTRMQVTVCCDNKTVVCAINKGRARDPGLMWLLHCLFFLTACNDMVLVASHIPGRTNLLADAKSRNQSPSLSFQMSQHPTPIPPALLK